MLQEARDASGQRHGLAFLVCGGVLVLPLWCVVVCAMHVVVCVDVRWCIVVGCAVSIIVSFVVTVAWLWCDYGIWSAVVGFQCVVGSALT